MEIVWVFHFLFLSLQSIIIRILFDLMATLIDFKINTPIFNEAEQYDEVEYDVVPLHIEVYQDHRASCKKIDYDQIQTIIDKNQLKIDSLNSEIDRLTSHADKWDVTMAIGSGVLTGLIDAFWVGEFNFEEFKADSHKHINKFIERYAKIRGYKDKGGGLKGAISFLEDKFPVDQDNVWKATGLSSTKLHHLEDLAHHPTPLGLLAAIGVHFFRCSVFANKNGVINFVSLETSKSALLNTWIPVIISGILSWMVRVVKSGQYKNADKDLPVPIANILNKLAYAPAALEILEVVDNWFGHEVSDMGGSKNTAGGGMGIPGVFLSLLKEISMLPGFKDTKMPKFISDLYSKEKIDMRAEFAIVEYLGKQSIPIIINECLVRSFYFVRRLIDEIDLHNDCAKVNWVNFIPWGNRTITRMLTISNGCFAAIDLADAAIQSTIKNATPKNPKFWYDFALRVNIVGEGRFIIAIVDDVRMGVKHNRMRDDRITLMKEQLFLINARLSYCIAQYWYKAKDTIEAVNDIEKYALGNLKSAYEDLMITNSAVENVVKGIADKKDFIDSEILLY